MPVSGKILEDSLRLSRIRKIKLTLYVAQVVMLVVLAFAVMIAFDGAAIEPTLYVPIDSFIAVIILLSLIICVESFFFRLLEIRLARSSSARHLMAKNSMRRAIIVAFITGVIAVMLAAPPIIGAIEDSTDTTAILSAGRGVVDFYSSDRLALGRVTTVHATALVDVDIYLVDEATYLANEDDLNELYALRINRDDYQVRDSDLDILIPATGFMKFVLVLNGLGDLAASARVDVVREASSTLTGICAIFMISFVAVNLVWAAYLVPIERKYSVGSIYK